MYLSIDDARQDVKTRGIQSRFRVGRAEVADFGDFFVSDTDIGG